MNAIDFLLPAELITGMLRVAIAGLAATCIAWLVCRLLRKKSRPLNHAILTCSLGILFVIPFLCTLTDGGLIPLLKLRSASSPGSIVTLPAEVPLAVDTEHVIAEHSSSLLGQTPPQETATEPLSMPVAESTRRPENTSIQETPFPGHQETLGPDSGIRSPVLEQEPASPIPSTWQTVGTWAAGLWLLGTCLFAIRIGLGQFRVWKLRNRCRIIDDPELETLALAAREQTGVKRAPALLASSQVPMPIAVGIVRPAIVLPEGWRDDFSTDELQAILLHETAHIARRDPSVGLFQRIVAATYWWNPLVHVLNRRLDDVREELCDNYVVRTQGHGHALAGLLLRVAERVSLMQSLPAAAGLAEPRNSGGLQERIVQLVDPHRDLSTKLSRKAIPVLLLSTILMAAMVVLFDVGVEEIQAQPPEPATPEVTSAEPEEVPDENVDILGYEQMDEVLGVLKMLEEKTRANHEKLKTWSGTGDVVRESHGHHLSHAPAEQVPPLRRRASFEFAIDCNNDALYSAWKDLIPISEVDPATGQEVPFADHLFAVQSIVTPEHWLRSATSEPVPVTDDLLAQEQIRREITRKKNDLSRLKFDGVIDMREAFTNGGQLIGNPKPIWEELSRLQRWPEFLKNAKTELRKERMKRYLQIKKSRVDDRKVITVTTSYYRSDDAEEEPNLILSIKLDERVGYNIVQIHRALDKLPSQIDIEYVSRNGIFIPSRLACYEQKWTSWEDEKRVGKTSEVVTIHEFQFNEPLKPSTFTYDRFALNEGERVVDEIGKQTLIQKDGKLIPTDNESAEEQLLSSMPVGLYRSSTTGARWNSLLRQHIDLSNHRLKVERGEIAVENYDQFLIEQNQREQAVANALVRLARKAGPSSSISFPALDLVVTSEYSGPVAEQAAELLVQDQFEHRQFPMLCGKLGFSLPPSLAAETVLRAAVEKSTDETVRAQACLSLGRFLRIKAQKLRMLNGLPSRRDRLKTRYGQYYVVRLSEVPAGALEDEAERLLDRVLNEFRHIEKTTWTDRPADRARLELAQLGNAIGRKAREIVGKDVNGRTMRLSDYDGKVRVLYFWGHWCPPCRKSYPVHRELVETYRDQPFAFLGINSDPQAATLQKLISDGDVTWDCWYDGAVKPWPLHEEWGLHGSSWTYVLDKQGRSRFYDVRGDELKEAVELLMKE